MEIIQCCFKKWSYKKLNGQKHKQKNKASKCADTNYTYIHPTILSFRLAKVRQNKGGM